MNFQFEMIGMNDEYYYFMAFNKLMDLSEGVLFYKTPKHFFDFMDKEQPALYFMEEVEEFIELYYDGLCRNNILHIISEDEFLDIVVRYEEVLV